MGSSQGPFYVGVILLLLLNNVLAECNLGCSGSSGSFLNYETGTNYKYKFEGSSITAAQGNTDDLENLKITAVADISALPNCVYSLKLSNVKIVGSDGKPRSSAKELEGKPISFSANNGKLTSEICTEADDSISSVNIKRAIVSLLQTTDKSETVSDIDVFGSCPTSVDVRSSGKDVIVKKKRNLNKCSAREELSLPFLSSTYPGPSSPFQSFPTFTQASWELEQVVSGGVVQSVKSEEVYAVNPVRTSQTGVVSKFSTKLTLTSQGKGAPILATGNKQRSVIFQSPHQSDGVANGNALLEKLKKTSDNINPTIGVDGAKDFSQLVSLLSQSKKGDIMDVYKKAKAGEGFANAAVAKKIFLDALGQAASGEGVEVMIDLLVNKEISELRSKEWLVRLSLSKHVSASTLKAAKALFKGTPSTEVYLGVGILAGKYCRQHSCEGIPEATQLQNNVAAPLMKSCKPETHDAEDQLIASLKGLRNFNYLSPKVVGKMVECASEKTARNRVRVAALEALASDPKKDEVISAASSILEDINEDSEVRINAYLVLVNAPSSKVAEEITKVLKNEKINQVGSFIVSHLRNLKASTNPDKAEAQYHLGGILTKSKFPIAPWKYSTNMELSSFWDGYNVGAAGESNIIYSQHSILPRSASLNVSTQLFGHSFNLFEIGARIENLERLIEHEFGPKGRVTTGNKTELGEETLSSLTKLKEKLLANFQSLVRPKRAITRPQLDALAKQVKLDNDVYDGVFNLDLSLKLFGQEVSWVKCHSNDESDPSNKKGFSALSKAVEKLKNIDIDYTRHDALINTWLSYPTGLGLPLKLGLAGSSAFRARVDGKIDIPAIAKDWENADVKLQIIPSAAIELAVSLTVDGILVETGLKHSINMHSSTGSDITIRLLEGKGVDVKLGLPVDDQTLVNFRSEIVSIIKEKGQAPTEKELAFKAPRKKFDACYDQLKPMIGITFCGTVELPWSGVKSLLPTAGPLALSLKAEKEDKSLSNYHFKTSYSHNKESGVCSYVILFDTPNTKTSRLVSLTVDGSLKPKPFFKVNLVSPWYSAKVDGEVVDSNIEKSAKLLVEIRDTIEYRLRAGVQVKQEGKVRNYTPLLEFNSITPGQKLQSSQTSGIKGSIVGSQKGKNDVLTFKDLSLEIGGLNYVLKGDVESGTDLIDANLKVVYGTDDVAIKGYYKMDEKDGKKKRHMKGEIIASAFKDFGISADWDLTTACSSGVLFVDSSLSAVHGPDPKRDVTKISLDNFLDVKYNEKKEEGKPTVYVPVSIITKNKVTYPAFDVSGSLNLQYDDSVLSYDVSAKASGFGGDSKLNVNRKDISYDFATNIDLDKQGLKVFCKRDVKGDKIKYTNSLELIPGGTYQANALVTRKIVDANDFSIDVNAELKSSNQPEGAKVQGSIKRTKDDLSYDLSVASKKHTYLATKLNAKRDGPSSGQYKINLPNAIVSDGELSVSKEGLSGKAQLDLVKQNKKMEAKAEVTAAEPKYNALIEIDWDKGTPDSNLVIKSENILDKKSFSTKNALKFKEHSAELNGNGKLEGEVMDGTLSGDGEVILPNKNKLSGRYTQTLKKGEVEAHGDVSYARSGEGPYQLSGKVVGKNIDLATAQLDGQATLTFKEPSGKDVSVNVNAKKAPSGGEKSILNGGFSVSGNLISHHPKASIESEVSNLWLKAKLNPDNTFPPANIKVAVSCDPEFSFDSAGKIAGNTLSGEVNLKTKWESAPSLKWTTSNFIDVMTKSKRKIKTNNAVNYGANKFVKVNLELGEEENGGNFKLETEGDSFSPKAVSGSVKIKTADKIQAGEGNLVITSDGKTADVAAKVENDPSSGKFSLKLNGNDFSPEKFDVSVTNELSKPDSVASTIIEMSKGDKKAKLTSKVRPNWENFLLDINVDGPVTQKLLFKSEKKGAEKWDQELKLKNNEDYVSSDLSTDLSSPEDFSIKFNLESNKLDKIKFDLSNKGGKKVSISVIKADKNLVSGSGTYETNESPDGATISGTGNVKILDESYPLKYSGNYKTTKDGKEVSVNGEAGKYSFKGENKIKPDELLVKGVYCSAPGSCKTAEIHSELKAEGLKTLNQQLNIQLDLSALRDNLNDVALKLKTSKKDLAFDQDLEVQLSPSNKMKYNAFIHDKKAGFSIGCPKRTVAAELTYDSVLDDSNFKLNAEGNFWPNKNDYPKVGKVNGLLKLSLGKITGGMATNNEISLKHPGLPKEYSIKGVGEISQSGDSFTAKGRADIDLFKDPSQAIVLELNHKSTTKLDDAKSHQCDTTLKASSKGLDMNVEVIESMLISPGKSSLDSKIICTCEMGRSESSFSASVKKIENGCEISGKLKILEKNILDFTESHTYKDGQIHYEGSMDLYGKNYKAVSNLKASPLDLSLSLKGPKGGIIEAKSMVDFTDKGEATASYNGKPLASATILLNKDNFLKTDFNYDRETYKTLGGALNQDYKENVDQISKTIESVQKTLTKCADMTLKNLKEAIPDLKPAVDFYTAQLDELKKDIESSEEFKALQSYVETSGLKSILEKALEVLKQLAASGDAVTNVLKETIEILRKIIKDLIPAVTEAIQNISKSLLSIAEDMLSIAVQGTNVVLEELKKIKIDSIPGSEWLVSLQEFSTDMVTRLGEEINNMAQLVLNQDLVSLEDVNQTFSLVKIQILDFVRMAIEFLRPSCITQEVCDLLDTTSASLEKLMNDGDMNPLDEIKAIVAKAKSALTAVFNEWQDIFKSSSSPWTLDQLLLLPTSLPPIVFSPVRISLINLLRGELPSIEDSLTNLASEMNIFDLHSDYTRAAVFGGASVVTFDMNQIPFQGSCSYILTEDYLDRNFSLIGSFDKGVMKSITLSDPQNAVELRQNALPLVNGKEEEFPAYAGDLKVWKRTWGFGASSKAGLAVMCDSYLGTCTVFLNVFYFDRVRGLLGTPNNEPYDDLTLPNGMLAESKDAFVNAWKLYKKCPDVGPAGEVARNPKCTEFLATSNVCRYALKSEAFRDSCDYVTSSGSLDGDRAFCNVAATYAYSCLMQTKLPLVNVPDSCAYCKVGDKSLNVGDTEAVKTGPSADIVLVVEQQQKNGDAYNNLIPPLVNQLKGALKAKGISDVNFGLAGFNLAGQDGYPDLFTSQGKLFNPKFDGKSKSLQFSDSPYFNFSVKDEADQIDYYASEMIGNGPVDKVYSEVRNYPFRPDAGKALIHLDASGCLPLSPVALAKRALGAQGMSKKGVSVNLLTWITGSVDGGETVVGYNRNEVFTIGKGPSYKSLKSEVNGCTLLLKGTDANIYNLKNFMDNDGLRKEAIKIIANNIAQELSVSHDLQCSCERRGSIMPSTQCVKP